MDTNDKLVVYAIYNSPADYPGKIVGRKNYPLASGVAFDPQPFYVGESLVECRKKLPRGVINLGRAAADDPVILETWM